jgi:hypothetical protein
VRRTISTARGRGSVQPSDCHAAPAAPGSMAHGDPWRVQRGQVSVAGSDTRSRRPQRFRHVAVALSVACAPLTSRRRVGMHGIAPPRVPERNQSGPGREIELQSIAQLSIVKR